MTRDEAFVRAREAACHPDWSPQFNYENIRAGRFDNGPGMQLAVRALMDADKPLPVDPDLIEARRIAFDMYGKENSHVTAQEVRVGNGDSYPGVKAILAGIKYGRTTA